MNRSVLILALFTLALVLVPSCSDSAEDQLNGTWTMDQDAMLNSESFNDMPEMAKKMAKDSLKNSKIEMTFDNGKMTGVIKMMGIESSINGSYEVKSSDGNKLVMVTTDKDGKKEEATVNIDGDKLSFESDGKTFHMLRK